ncbi:hypothetical protein BSKO_10039 [Bryopsis sp. KO-2023]|nr:hypothetical protein BSKO_10039 [Bryopsis sp. KO-2023]
MDAPASASFSLSSFSTLSKVLVGVMIAGYAASVVFPDSKMFLALVPGKTFPFVWNIVTSAFFVTNPLELCFDAIALLFTVKLVEPVYGWRGLLMFLFIVSAFTGALTFVTSFIIYFSTLNGPRFYSQINGFHGLLSAMLVAVKQVLPDQELALFGVLRFKAKWLCSFFVVLSIPSFLLMDPVKTLPFIMYGAYAAWLYLRYFQFNEETKLRGDPSADFSFASFFPEQFQSFVDPLAGGCAKLFRLTPKRNATEGEGHILGQPLPGSDGAEAARRRERGAKALEDRLKNQSAPKDVEEGNQE